MSKHTSNVFTVLISVAEILLDVYCISLSLKRLIHLIGNGEK